MSDMAKRLLIIAGPQDNVCKVNATILTFSLRMILMGFFVIF